MIEERIEHIICAVRGQPESRETVTRAIDLALEHNAHLTFCLVIDAEFLGQAAPTLSRLKTVYQQLEDMGEFSMLILCDRAQRRGVDKVDYQIRKGNVPEQLRLLASETEAQVLVLGRPMRGPGRSVFSPAEFDAFVEGVKQDTGIHVVEVVHEKSKDSLQNPRPSAQRG
jgi:nucleotide-binding universal stress UspA family protein